MKKILIFLFPALMLAGSQCQKTEQVLPAREPKKNITIESPKAGETIGFPFSIKGQARVFENQFNIRIKNSAGKTIYEDIATSDAPDAGLFGNYDKKIDYLLEQPADSNLIIEVLDYSAKDGSEQDLVSVPVKVNFGETQKVKIFLNNSQMDPEVSCNKVFPVERVIPKTQSPATAAVNLLLLGQRGGEQKKGFFTSINYGVKLQKLTIADGTARADFDEQMESGVGGSCRVSAIRAQITETLKQFPTVKNVIISINGRTEDILQP